MKPSAFEDSDWSREAELPPIQPLARDEAQALIAANPLISPWRVIAAQALTGLVVAMLWGVLSGQWTSLWSALWGAAVAVVPNALMARWVFTRGAGYSMALLLFWEAVKLCLAGVMLALAHVWIHPLNWVAMLVTLVLCLKVIGVAVFWHGRKKTTV